jgi:iron complex transport system ATP-binding protein
MDARLSAPASGPALSADGITIRVGARTLVERLSITLMPGEFLAVLGRNGSGKTLTLHTLAGLRAPAAGELRLQGSPLHQLGRRAIARRLGFLAQDLEDGFVTTAIESVLIGRHPHLSLWEWESDEDEQIARRSLAALEVETLAARQTDTLSGGERRRVAIAALLAQEPALFLLDEPTNHLDPHHQLVVLSQLQQLTRSGRTVIAALHDPTLAVRFADRALLLSGSGPWSFGPVREVVTAETLSELYLTRMLELEQDGRRVFVPA